MVRSVSKKYQVWLAGYYDDFNGARAIPDDRNKPTDTSYTALNSHYGNPMNGEAFLNPRFRFSMEDREVDSALTSDNKVWDGNIETLQNDGIFEWLTFDDTRLSKNEWEGRSQLQYPDGNIPNRYKFNNDTSDYSQGYQRFINGHNSDASYIVPTGDNDATFGRGDMKTHDATQHDLKNAGFLVGNVIPKGNFIQKAHLAGVFTGEITAHSSADDTPTNLMQDIYSPAKKPFLILQSSRTNSSNSATVPTIIYDGPLNTRLDGDIFTVRLAVQSAKVTGTWADTGIKFEIGFPISEAGLLNDTGYAGTPAIDYTLDLSSISYDTQALLTGGSFDTPEVTNDNVWLDIDFVFDYSNNNFDVYINGSSHATNIAMNDAAKDGTSDGATTASNLYGYQFTVTDEGTAGNNGYVSYLMLDRVGLVRCLTDDFTTTEEVEIQTMDIQTTTNGLSTCKITIADDPKDSGTTRGASSSNYLLNLRSLFVSSSPLNWNILVFADNTSRIDRPVWRGEVGSFNIKQKRRSRVLELQAFDTMLSLDKQIPLWDVGQKGQNTSEESLDYWSYDAKGFRDAMYLGAGKLKLLDGNVGFDENTSYKESTDQRTQLGSGHPIQMYNNENLYGPNDIEDSYEGYGIRGFVQDTASSNTVIIMQDSQHGMTTSTNNIINVKASNGFTKIGATVLSPSSGTDTEIEVSSTDVPYSSVREDAKIIYMGKFMGEPIASEEQYLEDLNSPTDNTRWFSFTTTHPRTTNATSNKLQIYFDTEPTLKIGDIFYINRTNNAGSVNLSSEYMRAIKVTGVKKMRNTYASAADYFTKGSTINSFIWVVSTNCDYSGSESHGTYANSSSTAGGTSFLSSSARFSFAKATGAVYNIFRTDLTNVQHRALHARWMRDLPQSLWFQYHFGVVKRHPIDEPPPMPVAGYLQATQAAGYSRISQSQTINSTTTVIEIDETAYDAAPNAGVAEIWSTKNLTPAIYKRADEFKEKFIYQAKVAVSGSPNKWYLLGVKYITGNYTIDSSFNYAENGVNKRLYVKFQDIDDDYKHMWLLWADMRNNGLADADGSQRKVDFGLQYPLNKNYDFDLYFADQVDENGRIDKFASLKVNEDLDVWNIDSTTDPITQSAFSKPIDYSSPQEITLQESGGKLRVVTGNTGTLASGDLIYLINTNDHDGMHVVDSVSSNTYIHTTTTYVGNGRGTGGAFYCPVVGSESDFEKYHDWENKAGAFIAVDASKFFNLNTNANGGKTGQAAGGRTDLIDYVVESDGERAGFPALIDNYWTEAISSYQTTGDLTLEHPNQNIMISDATLATDGFVSGYKGLPVNDITIFADEGIGKLVTRMNEDGNNSLINYFHWDGRLTTEFSSTGTLTVGSASTYFNIPYRPISRTGHAHITSGVTEGMVLRRTATDNTVTELNILKVHSEEEIWVFDDGNWATSDTYVIPIQLANVTTLDGSQFTSADEIDYVNLEQNLWDVYHATNIQNISDIGLELQLGTTEGGETTPVAYEVHATVYSEYMLRLMMHIDGFYKNPNGGTYWDSDKIRMLWNAAIMDTWLPSAKVNSIYDINNVPITSIMSDNDSYGSIVDSRSSTLGSIIGKIQQKSGYGTNGTYQTFTYGIGRDNRFEFRPNYNSGIVLNRDNMTVNNISVQLSGQITNVRVYYNEGASFADWPSVGLDDTTTWKILDQPSITSGSEALLIAQQEYNKYKNNPLSISAEPFLDGTVGNKMIDDGRYGYIADPYIALGEVSDALFYGYVTNWTRVGLGGVPFNGMVNALDGNMNISISDLGNRYGTSKEGQTASGDIKWKNNYYWYGSNSISNAVQIVHIPNKTPFVSTQTGEHLRMWIGLKETQAAGATIDTAEFTIYLSDYSFSNDKDKTATLTDATYQETLDVKHSGFYEVPIPATYGAQANATIVVSFNAEYCRALLRHRCGNPNGSTILSDYNHASTPNTDSIFPIGCRKYTGATEIGSSTNGGFRDNRAIWYAPRVHVCRDLSYVKGSAVLVTDKGLELTNEPMIIQNVNWSVKAGSTEDVKFTLERDESIEKGDLISYLFPNTNTARQKSKNNNDSSNQGYEEQDDNLIPPRPRPPTGGSLIDPFKPRPSGTTDSTGTLYDAGKKLGLGDFSSTAYGKLKGRMNLPSDSLSPAGKFSILGSDKPSITPTTMKGIEGMDVDISSSSGNTTVTSDGYVFAAKGLQGAEGNIISQESSIETTFNVPQDIVSNRMSIQAYITHGPTVSSSTTNAVLYVSVSIPETGKTFTNEIKVKTGISNQSIAIMPLRPIEGLKNAGRKIKVTVTRKAGMGNDDANTTSLTIHNLEIKMHRASAHTTSSSSQFSPI